MCEEHLNDKNVISLPAFAISGNSYIDQQYLPSEFHSLVPCALSVQSFVMTSLFLKNSDWSKAWDCLLFFIEYKFQ